MDPDDEALRDAGTIHSFSGAGWVVEFTAYPVPAEYRGQAARAIGIEMTADADEITDDQALERVLRTKASRYGRLNQPFVIAVSEQSWERAPGGEGSEWHRTNALFGRQQLEFSSDGGSRWTRDGRTGLWRRRDGRWLNTRVSGVLLTTHLTPWNVFETVPELWINPNADYPSFPRLPHWRIRDIEVRQGAAHLVTSEPTALPR